MDADAWDARYGGSDLVWSIGPNVWVAEAAADLPPGRALDVAGGEGRNALWLAQRGWQVDLIDFSPVALARAEALAAERAENLPGSLRTRVADVTAADLEARAYQLVVVAYLQLPAPERAAALRGSAEAVAPGGLLLVTAHDSANLVDGFGGPQDPAVLYTPADVLADIEPSGLVVRSAASVRRRVDTPGGPRDAIDVLVLAQRD